jgi:hypothetical protein
LKRKTHKIKKMARKKQASFKMKGHTLPGVNQKSETVNKKDGRSPSSAFQQKSSPNKILGLAGLAKPLIKGVKNIFGGGGGDDESDEGGKLLEDTGKTITKTTGFTVSGSGDATTDAGTTIPEPGGGAAATNKPDEVLTMKSPNKKKLKSSIKSTVGGKLGGTSYKTASPYSK